MGDTATRPISWIVGEIIVGQRLAPGKVEGLVVIPARSDGS